jgi:hypothetical protein
MPVSKADVEALRQLPSSRPDDGQPSPFDSLAEVLGYVVAIARTEGVDEVDAVELVARAIDCDKDDLLRNEAVLRPLGYRAVADRLHRLARRAPEGPMNFKKRWVHKIGRRRPH